MKGEYTGKYIGDNMPRKPYKRKFVLRERKPFELYWHEILIALFIIFMLFMLLVNYISTRDYVPQTSKPVEIDIDASVGANETMEAAYLVQGLNLIYLNSQL
ncbi:MAG: hypothetical protein HGA85_06160 [Nanoarchaeota archaeon]|nr:hypothetical protein [Nanoarchaeota archaeon]